MLVCDLDEDKAQQQVMEFDVPAAYTDYPRMLDEQALDVMDIATRPMNHLELVTACAGRGMYVLC